jgi:hypothetical protein
MLRPLPDTRECRSARWYHPARPVPSSRFLTVSTVFSAASPASLFHLAPAMGFTTLPASPRAHRRNDGAKLAFPVMHEPFEVCPRLQPYRVTTASSTLTLRLVELAPGSAPVTGSTPTCTGKLEPTEVGLHVPATPWGATTADESAAMQLCKHDPRSEDQTCALARSLDAASPATEMAASETPRQSGRLRGVAPLTSP